MNQSRKFKVQGKHCKRRFRVKVSEPTVHPADIATLTCPRCGEEFQIPAIDIIFGPECENPN